MSFIRRLFGGGGSDEGEAKGGDAPAERPDELPTTEIDLSGASNLIDLDFLDWNETAQLDFLRTTLPDLCGDRLAPLLASDRFRGNPHCSPADAAILFAMTARLEPGRIMEIGSGYTTRVFRHAKEVYRLPGELISIDPKPTTDIFEDVDAHLEQPVQAVPVDDFEILVENEIVFLDTPHIFIEGNELDYLYRHVLPALKPGVVVGIHGIRLPRNYRREEIKAGYSEQMLLADYLRDRRATEVLVAGAWLAEHHPDALRNALPATARESDPTCFWFRVG